MIQLKIVGIVQTNSTMTVMYKNLIILICTWTWSVNNIATYPSALKKICFSRHLEFKGGNIFHSSYKSLRAYTQCADGVFNVDQKFQKSNCSFSLLWCKTSLSISIKKCICQYVSRWGNLFQCRGATLSTHLV